MKTLFVLLSLLLATPAYAVNDWGCANSSSSGSSVSGSSSICYDFDTSAETTFRVNGSSAMACLRLDSGSGTTIGLYYCPNSDRASASTSTCIQASPEGGDTLNGVGGSSSSQRACLPISRGLWLADINHGTGTSYLTVEGTE